MLIDFKPERYGLSITGVIHIGAHHGQEYAYYLQTGIKNIVFIEPATEAFKILRGRVGRMPGVRLYNVACGSEAKTVSLNIETANQGQSNSILLMNKHLEQHPGIEFISSERVEVITLDSLNLLGYNMLNIDVQGYEAEVLKGAKETLKEIEIIYIEVNRDETYTNCARVDEIDSLLHEFDRVKTKWVGIWGDAIYIRKTKSGAIYVPEVLRPVHPQPYPPDNNMDFERWFYLHFKSSAGRIYLPIFWTAYYCHYKYGKDMEAMQLLQKFIDSLDKSLKYFTIVQYDDGILNNISGLDIKVFSMSGGRIDYPLPLLCPDHNYRFPNARKIHFANFMGRKTHPIRDELMKNIFFKHGIFPLHAYSEIIAQSTFTLCPRGYGISSFRIKEAMQYGSIPVYISDQFIIPHDIPFYTYGVIIKREEIPKLESILRNISPLEIKNKQDTIKLIYDKYFTYEGCYKIILEQTRL